MKTKTYLDTHEFFHELAEKDSSWIVIKDKGTLETKDRTTALLLYALGFMVYPKSEFDEEKERKEV